MNCIHEDLFRWSDCSSDDAKANGSVYTAVNRQMYSETFTVRSTGWRNCIMPNSWVFGNIQKFDSTDLHFLEMDFSSESEHITYKETGFVSTPFFPFLPPFSNHNGITLLFIWYNYIEETIYCLKKSKDSFKESWFVIFQNT